VHDIFKDLRAEGLAVDVKDSEAVNINPKHIPALHKAPLLSFEACSFADISYDLRPFIFTLFSFSAVLVIY
jgi:DNA phosphorothioation-dependent restriction protein DptG